MVKQWDYDRMRTIIEECEVLPEDNYAITHEYYDDPIRYVNAYSTYLEKGGPEEGGWNYTSYSPLASIPVKNKGDMKDALIYLDDYYNGQIDPDSYPFHSVLSDGGITITFESHQAKYQPEERPHYE